MKLDKDTLVKQRFWLMLGGAVVLVVVSFFLMATGVRSSIDKERKAVDQVIKNLTSFGDAKSDEWVKLAERSAAEKEKQKTVVWQAAAAQQADIMTWPDAVEDAYEFRDGQFAKEITATRKKDEKGEAGEAPKNDASHFRGTITEANDKWIKVAGNPRKFFQTPDTKVQITAEPEIKDATFSSLKIGDRVSITFERGKYFGDSLTTNQQTDFATSYNAELGNNQLKEIIALVEPLNAKGEGVVQFPGWVPSAENPLPPKAVPYFHYVFDEWKRDKDISDEAWMAQEDLWIQREIYRLVRAANDSVARFQPDKEKEGVFTNPYWRITALVAKDKTLNIKITNLLDQRQDLDVTFRMLLKKEGNPVLVKIPGLPLAPKGTPASKDAASDTLEVTYDAAQLGVVPQGVFGIEQVLTWKTAAVKRIDDISMGIGGSGDSSVAHRMYAKTLKPFREPEKKEEPKTDPANPAPTLTEAPGPARRPFRGGPGREGLGVAVNATSNGLVKDRYLEVSREARRMPIGVVLIVDQQHVERVQAAFADSKLRFLTTQVIMNRYPKTVRPQETAEAASGVPAAPGPRTERTERTERPRLRQVFPPVGGPRLGGMVPGRGGRFPGPWGGGAETGSAEASDEQESNVELVLYGIVSLYERFPPRAAGPATPNP
jgi:hypothetical protein